MSAVATRLALEARGITKSFGHVEALSGVDFDVAPAPATATWFTGS